MSHSNEKSHAAETLELIPLMERYSAFRRAAFAGLLKNPERFDDDAILPDRGPSGCIRILGADSLVRMVRLVTVPELPDNVFLPDDFDPQGSIRDSARRRFGGAILPEIGAGPERIQLIADGPVTIYTLTPLDFSRLRESLAWRVGRKSVDRLIESLEIARLLAVSMGFTLFDRRERHAFAAVMVWRQLQVGDTGSGRRGPLGELCVVGEGAKVRCTIGSDDDSAGSEAQRVFEQSYGEIFGLNRLVKFGTRNRSFAVGEVTRAGRGAVLPPISPLRAARLTPVALKFIRGLTPLFRHGKELMDALERSPLFAEFPRSFFFRLLFGGRVVLWRVGHHVPPVLELGAGLAVVYEGELVRHGAPVHSKNERLHVAEVYGPGDVVGEKSFVFGLQPSERLQPRVPTRLVALPPAAIFEALSHHDELALRFAKNAAALQQKIFRGRADRERIEAVSGAPVATALLESIHTLPRTMNAGLLAYGLASSVERQFNEASVVIRLSPDGPREVHVSDGDITQFHVRGAADDLVRALGQGLEAARDAVQAVVVVDDALDPAPLREVVERVLYINSGTPVDKLPETEKTPFVYAAVVSSQARGYGSRGCPHPPGTVRLRPGSDYLRGLSEDQFDRWARAMTDRRVGVALGGGGSWGYYHVAVIRALRQLEVPIDMVSGTSFGAVVGAFHAHDPEKGMGRLLDHQGWVQAGNIGNYFSGVFFERMLDVAFEGIRLEDLECPFLPVATDLVTGSQTALYSGTVGRGVRASGAYAPILPAMQDGGATYVDGGMSANVPAHILVHEGAGLIISSDAVPAARQRPGVVSVINQWPVDIAMDLVNWRRRMPAFAAGHHALLNSAGEMSAAVAPVKFDSNKSISMPVLLLNGKRIVRNAMTDPDFWASLRLAEMHWESLREPRG